MIMNDNLEALALVNDLCNRLGIDTISCGATIAFIMEVFEKGLLTREEMDGLDLAWGNVTAAMDLVNRIAYRKGFGNRGCRGKPPARPEHRDPLPWTAPSPSKGLNCPCMIPGRFTAKVSPI